QPGEVTPLTPALRTSGIEDGLEEGTVLGKESIGLRSVFESGSGKENSSTGPALSFSHERKVTWTRGGALVIGCTTQDGRGAQLGLFTVEKSGGNAFLF